MVSLKATFAAFGLWLLFHQIPPSLAYPSSPRSSDTSLSYTPNYDNGLFRRADPQDFYLRIMPLGASITAGTQEPADDKEKNGYRKHLRDKLRSEGWKVNMVGNFKSGTMADNDHEGVTGERVSQIYKRADPSLSVWLPNVVLINAGTNDANQDGEHEPLNAVKLNMRELIDGVFSRVPEAVVVLSTLLPSKDSENIDYINDQYRELYREYIPLDEDGNEVDDPTFNLILADMNDGFISFDDDIHDGIHPTVEGQRKMAAVWDWAISKANEKGWLNPPVDSGNYDDNDGGSSSCRKNFGGGNDDPRAGRKVLHATNSVIRDDGKYVHKSRAREDRGDEWWATETTRLYFAQLYNKYGADKLGARDDLVWVSESHGDVFYRANHGDGDFGNEKKLDVKIPCKVEGIHWGDVNGDVLDDFICIAKDGEMDIGSYSKPVKDYGQEHVRLGDIDGDGRLDYCVIKFNGDINCWRNFGLGERATAWQDMGSGGPVFKGKGMGDMRGVRFVDINGDGRYDWIWMDMEGKVTTCINQLGEDKGMIPRWVDSGVTHPGMKTGIPQDRRAISFRRIFGDNGKADYVHWWRMKRSAINEGSSKFTWKAWENQGEGGRYQKGDGIRWADMTGTGVDDYIWIAPWSSDGEVNIFLNKNTKNDTDDYETPAWSTPKQLKTGLNWRGLHFGDWDGDGMADIIGITNKDTGSIKVWFSRWDGSEFNWEEKEIPGSDKCREGWGLLYTDHGAHFADITGSGRVDYLCMGSDGTTTGWLRDENGDWFDARQVKYTEELDRANFRFADADGDGRADLIWTDKFTGDGKVWYNKRMGDDSDRDEWGGSLFEWDRPVKAYLGSSRGPNMHYPNLGGEGRADMVGANPTTGQAWVWFNSCPAGGDDVDGPIPDPNLPEYNPPPTSPEPGPDPDDHWFCSVNGASWTPELWNEHRIGRWLIQRSELYVDTAWPEDAGGVPQVIALYDKLEKGDAWNWDDTCNDVRKECGIDDDYLKKDQCLLTPERAFSLWAMRNLALFIQRWKATIASESFTASLFTADIARTFLEHSAEDTSADAASWLTIVSGIFGTIGASLPSAGGLAGTLTMSAGIAGMLPDGPADEPKFDDFASLQSELGTMVMAVGQATEKYFSRILSETPPDGNWDRGTELARVLESGVFADQNVAKNSSLTDAKMVNFIRAAIISEAWNAGEVFIVKWSEDNKLAYEWGFSPCFGKKNRYGMDHAVACQFDKNYMILKAGSDGIPEVGQDEDTLAEYDLDHKMIIRAAEWTQERAGEFRPRNMEVLQSMFKEMIENPTDVDNGAVLERMLVFNVPVCDLDKLSDDQIETDYNSYSRCKETIDDTVSGQEARCLVDIVSNSCKQLTLGRSEWPYDPKWPK